MAVKLRLRRMGKKKRPFYRIVAADSRAPRDGRFIELVGTYDPISKPMNIELQEDRVMFWLQNGAQPTDTVKNLFQKKGVWLKWHLKKSGADDAKITEEIGKWQLLQRDKEARQQVKAEEKKRLKAEAMEKEAEEKEVEAAVAEAPAEKAPVEKEPETVEEQVTAPEEVKAEETAPVEATEEESAEKPGEASWEKAEDTEEKS